MNRILATLQKLSNRQRYILAGVLALLLLLGLILIFSVGRTSAPERVTAPTPASTEESPIPSPVASPTPRLSTKQLQILSQDPQERDPALRAQVEQELNAKPAFQKLPYSKDDVFIYFVDATPDNKAVLEIVYSGTREAAEAVYRDFLEQNNDPGTGYVVQYYQSVH